VHRQEFVPFEVESGERPTEAGVPAQQLKFAGRSHYDAEYPDWGTYRAIPAKPDNLPYRGGEIPFTHESAYAGTYVKPEAGGPT
jgi:hypothetical protein